MFLILLLLYFIHLVTLFSSMQQAGLCWRATRVRGTLSGCGFQQSSLVTCLKPWPWSLWPLYLWALPVLTSPGVGEGGRQLRAHLWPPGPHTGAPGKALSPVLCVACLYLLKTGRSLLHLHSPLHVEQGDSPISISAQPLCHCPNKFKVWGLIWRSLCICLFYGNF